MPFWSSGPNLRHVREDRGRYSVCFDYHVGFHGGFSCSPDVDAARRLLQALKCRRHRRRGDGESPTGCQFCRLWSRNPSRTLFLVLSKIAWYQGDPKLAETDCVCFVKSSTVTTLGSEFFSFRLFTMIGLVLPCLLYTSPSPRDMYKSRMPSSA